MPNAQRLRQPFPLLGHNLIVLMGCGAALFLCACKDKSAGNEKSSSTAAPPASSPQKPARLYLPSENNSQQIDLSREGQAAEGVSISPTGGPLVPSSLARSACPPEMVYVAGSFCIDRFEVHLVEVKQGRELSPFYPPSRARTESLYERWVKEAPRSGRALGRSLAVPAPPDYQFLEEFEPKAVSSGGVTPAGYLSRGSAEMACRNAGKRLCRREEWVQACRGEQAQNFPYGPQYREAACNVHRHSHPAGLLHGDSSRNHLDPRLGLSSDDEGPLLRATGSSPECQSRWGNDAIYDMVGNLDEWIDEPGGSFVGGFYSRGTKEGCYASIDSHDPGYLDYSLGTRCCSSL